MCAVPCCAFALLANKTHTMPSCVLCRAVHRGKFRSKPWQALLDEAKFLVDSGVRELNLIAG